MGSGSQRLPVDVRCFMVAPHRESLRRFKHFSYQTGMLAGLPPTAGSLANGTIAASVKRAIASARGANRAACMGGQRKCAYFVQTLKQDPCVPGLVCIRSVAGLLPSGANDGQETVTALPIDVRTGRVVPLSRVAPPSSSASFIRQLNAAVSAKLAAGKLRSGQRGRPQWHLKTLKSLAPQGFSPAQGVVRQTSSE